VKTSAHRREIAPYVALAGQETRGSCPNLETRDKYAGWRITLPFAVIRCIWISVAPPADFYKVRYTSMW